MPRRAAAAAMVVLAGFGVAVALAIRAASDSGQLVSAQRDSGSAEETHGASDETPASGTAIGLHPADHAGDVTSRAERSVAPTPSGSPESSEAENWDLPCIGTTLDEFLPDTEAGSNSPEEAVQDEVDRAEFGSIASLNESGWMRSDLDSSRDDIWRLETPDGTPAARLEVRDITGEGKWWVTSSEYCPPSP